MEETRRSKDNEAKLRAADRLHDKISSVSTSRFAQAGTAGERWGSTPFSRTVVRRLPLLDPVSQLVSELGAGESQWVAGGSHRKPRSPNVDAITVGLLCPVTVCGERPGKADIARQAATKIFDHTIDKRLHG